MGTTVIFSASRMQEIEDGTITAGLVDVDGHLLLTRHDGGEVDAGLVKGTDGAPGAPGTPGAPGAPGTPGVDGFSGRKIGDINSRYSPGANDLELNGQAVSRSTYSDLFALYGTTYGVGNGSTTFNLPDLRKSLVRLTKTSGQNSNTTAGVYNALTWEAATGTAVGTPMWASGDNTKIKPNRKGWWRFRGKYRSASATGYAYAQLQLNGVNNPQSEDLSYAGSAGAYEDSEEYFYIANPGTDYVQYMFANSAASQGSQPTNCQFDAEFVGTGQTYDSTDGPKLYVTALGAASPAFGGSGGGGAHLLGAVYPWTAALVPTWGLELNGQTIIGGATTFSGIAALNPSWVSGANLVLPDWRGRVPAGYKSGDAMFGTQGALVGEAAHMLTQSELAPHSHQPGRAGVGNPPNAADTNDMVARSSAGVEPNFRTSSTLFVGSGYGSAAVGAQSALNVVQPSVVVKWVVCVATEAGEFDTEVQTALVSRVSVLENKGWKQKVPTSIIVTGAGASYVINPDGSITLTSCVSVHFVGVQPADNTHPLQMRASGIFSTSGAGGYLYTAISLAGAIVGGSAWSGGLSYRQVGSNGVLQSSDVAGTPWIGYMGAGVTKSDILVEYIGAKAAYPRIKVPQSSYAASAQTTVWGSYQLNNAVNPNADGAYVVGDTAFNGTFEFWELVR